MRDVGKDLRNLQLALMKSNDKPIFYISRIFGMKYIVPRSEYEKLERENLTMKKVLSIIKEKNVDIKFLRTLINSDSEYTRKNALKIYNLCLDSADLAKQEFELLKRWLNE